MLKNNRQAIALNFADHEFQLLASGGCFWPQKKTLIVSDLHLEKGSYFALRGQPLPLTDTRCTLERLQQEIQKFQPKTVICLGDNVHDANGFMRMKTEDLIFLQSLCQSVNSWKWIIGNHDTENIKEPSLEKSEFVSEVIIDNLYFTHELQPDKPIQIIGHYHPKVAVKKQGVTITGKCFSVAKQRMILPAFGSYTGGLDIKAKVYHDILKGQAQYYMIFKDSIFVVK